MHAHKIHDSLGTGYGTPRAWDRGVDNTQATFYGFANALGSVTGINALDLGIPLTLITESVFARCVSALKEERIAASGLFTKPSAKLDGCDAWLADVRQALLAAKIISYAQGFMLMRAASEQFDWSLNYGNVALLWREGCILRSAFLANIRDAFEQNPAIAFLGLDPYFQAILYHAFTGHIVVSHLAGEGLTVIDPANRTATPSYPDWRR